MKEREYKKVNEPVSLESQERLVKIMTDSPTIAKLAGTEWEIRPLRPMVQWMIAEEAVKIKKVEAKSFGEVLDCFNGNMSSVVRILTLALLNDKDRIKRDYESVYETLMWESNPSEWANFLLEVLSLLDVEFFFATTKVTQIFREASLKRKMTMEERERYPQEQSLDK